MGDSVARNVKSVLLALLFMAAALMPAASLSAAQAQDSNPDDCRGFVSSFYKSNGRVYLHYRVSCTRTQDSISASAFLRRAASDYKSIQKTRCYKTKFCTGIASLKDKAGSQRYYARTSEDIGPPPDTYADRKTVVVCGEMACGAGSKLF
jgi:hypothetical protein